MQWREHAYQVTGEMMSREFTRLRDALELYNCEASKRPMLETHNPDQAFEIGVLTPRPPSVGS